MKSKPAPRRGGRTARPIANCRPKVELLESKLLPGETFWLGLWALSLTRPLPEPFSPTLETERRDAESPLHRYLIARPDTADAGSTISVWNPHASTEARRDQTASAWAQPPAAGVAADVLDDVMALSTLDHPSHISHGSAPELPGHRLAENAATVSVASNRGEALSVAATSGVEGQAPGSLLPFSPIVPATPRLAPDSVTFDPWTGEVAIRGDNADSTIQETLTPRGYIDVTLDGQHHSSDPASAAFNPHLAGATAARLTGIRLDGDGGQGTLILGPQQLEGRLNVTAPGAEVITEDITLRGPMTVQASNITIRGTLRGSAVTLDATAWVSVEPTGAVVAEQGNRGGRISVIADKISNTGQLRADGQTGGRIDVQARNILNAGSITADGTQGPGGTVSIAFTGAYIDTVAALTTANSGSSGQGGHVVLNGGTTGRLFSSGRQQAMASVGGSVDLLGREIVLDGGAVDVSGETGGGAIRVGGDFHGRNPTVANAATVTVTPATTLRADALKIGDGGRVAVWSDAGTEFQGTVSARGGQAGGPGGFIEVSARGSLAYGGSANAGARRGKTGTLLLDPKNLIVSTSPTGVFPQFDLLDPHPTVGGLFSANLVLSNGNIVATSSGDNFGDNGAGAAYLFDGSSGVLISSLFGSNANDSVGFFGAIALSNGNYLVRNLIWNGGSGAVTWGSGVTGVNGIVSETNSLVGSTTAAHVGSGEVIPLTNGNYLVLSPYWQDLGALTWGNGTTGTRGTVSETNSLVGGAFNVITLNNGNYLATLRGWNNYRGAVTWGSGTVGVSGVVSQDNSLVGANPGDQVGFVSSITVLPNGNYVVDSVNWNGNRGAVTWGSGTAGVRGIISEANSLVGTSATDQVGYGVIPLSNGNYVVESPYWNGWRGAVTWGSGTAGVRGLVSEANSLVGSDQFDLVGADPNGGLGFGVTALYNGNYVVRSSSWHGSRGAVTWGDGSAGVQGTVSEANSLVGSDFLDRVGYSNLVQLPNSNYVVVSEFWNNNRGAVTWGSGTAAVRGVVSEVNSLISSVPNDRTGISVRWFSNGNYLVQSPYWNGSRGAVTWGSGTAGVRGIISEMNSLVGTNANDRIGLSFVPFLPNGNYVVPSASWDGNRGAVTWASGTAGISGVVSEANSLVGASPNDAVGGGGVTTLANGNYVVRSPSWGASRGAVTWADGSTGTTGVVSEANSLVGANSNDAIGSGGSFGLPNGNYVVASPSWNARRGAVTWVDASTRITGVVSEANSLVGANPGDAVGNDGVVALANGNYVVRSLAWNNSRGAVTWADGRTATRGTVSETNSLVGSTPGDLVGFRDYTNPGVIPLPNGNLLVYSTRWNGFFGALTWEDGTAAFSGTVSAVNSVVGSNPYALMNAVLMFLSNGNYVVGNQSWNNNRGVVIWGSATHRVSGPISDANSVFGSDPGDRVGGYINGLPVIPLSDGNYLVHSGVWNGGRGAVTWVNGTTGQKLDGRGVITAENSVLGRTANDRFSLFVDSTHNSFVASFAAEGSGRVTIGLTNPNEFTYAHGQLQTVTLTPDFLTATLNSGTAVILQASNDITVEDPITVNAGGHGGALTLQAGRSILLNASITTDNGPLTLIANDTRADGVVDSQRGPGNAAIIMAGGTTLDTGTAPLDIELRDGAGLTHADSRAINLQTLIAGSVNVVNDGPDPGSDIRLGPVITTGPQSYSDPNGTTLVTAGLTSGDYPISFTDSVVVGDGVSVDAGSATVNFAGDGTQTLQSGDGAFFSNLDHTGDGVLQLTSGLAVAGTLLQSAGTFDANDQPVTVGGPAILTGGTYLAGTAPQTFAGGLVLTDGTFTSSTGPMSLSGDVTLTGGTFGGEGTADSLTVYRGTFTPGTTDPGVLAVANAVRLTPLSTFRVLVNGPDPGTGYSQLTAGGPLDLGGSTLDLALGFAPPVGSSFVILATGNTAGVRGTFAGLPEGVVFSQDGYQFQITYHGGDDGNSVVLTCLA